MRLRRTIKAGLLALVAATALLTVGSLNDAKRVVGVERADAAGKVAASRGAEQPKVPAVAARVKAVPFTALDLVLLGSGAATLLLLTAAGRDGRRERADR